MKENLENEILRGLYEYQQKNPGNPKMAFKKLLTQIHIGENHEEAVHEELFKLEEKGWINSDFLEDGQAGLIYLTSDGVDVAEQISLIPEKSDSEKTFVPDYKHDIFVSFTSEDEQEEEWINKTKRDVKQLLDIGHINSRWVEYTEITSRTMKDLNDSATFLIFLSRSYLHSPWCHDENFLKALQTRTSTGAKIFLIDMGDFVEEFLGIISPQQSFNFGYSTFVLGKNGIRYRNQLRQLSQELDHELEKLKAEAPLKTKTVLINSDEIDKKLAQSVMKKLKSFKVGYILPIANLNGMLPSKFKRIGEYISRCRGLLLIYGKTDIDWLNGEIVAIADWLDNHKKSFPHTYAIYDGPPDTNPLPDLSFHGMILNCRQCLYIEQEDCTSCSHEKELFKFVDRLREENIV